MTKPFFHPRLAVFLAVMALASRFVLSQIATIEKQRFSDRSAQLKVKSYYPGPLSLEIPPAGQLLARWGIHFEAAPGWIPSLLQRLPYYENTPSLDYPTGIGNVRDACQCGAPDSPLAVRFEIPVKRVGFMLGSSWGHSTHATLRFYDVANNLLGSTDSETGYGGVFVAVETSSVSGISKAVIDVPTGYLLAVDEIELDYLFPRPFVNYVSQIGDGVTAGRIVQTSLAVLNNTSVIAEGTVKFFDNAGAPMPVFLQNAGTTQQPSAQVTFTVPPFSSFHAKTGGKGINDPVTEPLTFFPASGYAKIESQVPVDVTAGYTATSKDDGSVAEAGVAASRAWISAMTDVENRSDTKTQTAVALVNTENRPVGLSISLYDNKGTWLNVFFAELAAHEHLAKFVDEIFEGYVDLRDFSGTLRIGANGRLTGLVIRTHDGLPTAAVVLSAAEE